MAQVTITFSDTDDKTVSIKTDGAPAVGKPLTPAQAAALDVYIRACHHWGVTAEHMAKKLDATAVQIANYGAADGVDIDRVHRIRDNVVNQSL